MYDTWTVGFVLFEVWSRVSVYKQLIEEHTMCILASIVGYAVDTFDQGVVLLES